METKICGKCKKEKPVSEFYKSKRDGYRSRCKSCNKEDFNAYAKTAHFREYQRNYYQKPEIKKHKKEYQSRATVRERIKLLRVEYRKRPEVKIKNMARWYLNHEIRAGRINREPCAMCGKMQSEAHHPDYNQPLLIVWLCANCHCEAHLNLKEKEEK